MLPINRWLGVRWNKYAHGEDKPTVWNRLYKRINKNKYTVLSFSLEINNRPIRFLDAFIQLIKGAEILL